MPGKLTILDDPRVKTLLNDSVEISLAIIRFLITVLVEQTHSFRDVGTGNGLSLPFSGSRMIPEQKLDAAPDGLPGRTIIVGRRTILPSSRPLLE